MKSCVHSESIKYAVLLGTEYYTGDIITQDIFLRLYRKHIFKLWYSDVSLLEMTYNTANSK